jgi:hypothetical protein
MSIPNKQIGWSNEANLLYQISKQLEYLTQITAKNSPSFTAYSQSLTFPITYASLRTKCDGSIVGNIMYTAETVNDINELVTLFNTNIGTKVLGTYSSLGADILILTTTTAIKNALCPTGTLTLDVFAD